MSSSPPSSSPSPTTSTSPMSSVRTTRGVHYVGSTTTPSPVDAICLGSGRFLRSVLVPALNAASLHPVIFQTRGRTFLDHCVESNRDNDDEMILSYEVDTVLEDGRVKTEGVICHGAATLGSGAGRVALWTLLERMETIRVIGVGLTEAGINAGTKSQSLIDLTDLLYHAHTSIRRGTLQCPNPRNRICIINTDNIPNNGSVIRGHVLAIARDKVDGGADGEGGGGDGDGEGGGGGDGGYYDIDFLTFLEEGVTFHDSMVDRITSARDGSGGMVPRCEPVPLKALVIEDLGGDLPPSLSSDELRSEYGVVIRTRPHELESDIALKLRVANGTHTAAAHAMALSSLPRTDCLSSSADDGDSGGAVLMRYLDEFFHTQILPGAEIKYGREETLAVYDDWRRRLCHPRFGLSSFFICQNGAAKGGIRIAPTVRSLLLQGKTVNVSTTFSLAAILRYFTPSPRPSACLGGVNRGSLDGFVPGDGSSCDHPIELKPKDTVSYADNMHYNLSEGWYEFKTSCMVQTPKMKEPMLLCDALGALVEPQQPSALEDVVRGYLTSPDGGDMLDLAKNDVTAGRFDVLTRAVSTLLARMVAGDATLDILREIINKQGVFARHGLQSDCVVLVDGPSSDERSDLLPLHYRPSPIPDDSRLMSANIGGQDVVTMKSVVFSEVCSALAIDLHTHLLPPSHGMLCLWGVDELLTYHYLVAEYFMTAPVTITPSEFYSFTKRKQADLIWRALFIDRSPVSEACRGVVTTLERLGLSDALMSRDLDTIRSFFDPFRDDGLDGVERYSETVYDLAGVRYAVMTNIPFDANEAQHWRPKRKEYPHHYKSALRVDPLLAGDSDAVKTALKTSGYDFSLEGARQYLRDWVDIMQPEYMMASTPHNFSLKGGEGVGMLAGVKKTGVNEDAMKAPFAFADAVTTGGPSGCTTDCDGEDDATASLIDENSDFLSEVLMRVCEERDLPLALKIGAHRGVNPQLQSAGDGMVAFADATILARLCTRFPKVRFLATFLSRNNQHEACVMASKFRNLHIYGCWWYCNNPSMIEEITSMRVEMLGTSFTAQHSDARVLDQLIYKWSHSRAVIASVLAKEYTKLSNSGWVTRRSELRRDVRRLFGVSYEEFMAKSFVK